MRAGEIARRGDAIDGVRLAAAPGPLTSVVADRVREVIAAAVRA